jgi:hypothetical protein
MAGIKKGQKAIGNWGAMHPWSYGEVVKVENGEATVRWEDGLNDSVEPISSFKTGTIGEIGLYVQG